jgi:two-component system, LytTR family, response regulator LytT
MNILIIEDEPLIAQRLMREVRSYFENQLERLIHADDLYEAQDHMEKIAFDLVLLDLNLYGQDGFKLLKLSSASAFHTIVVSAHADRAITAFEFGVLDFVAKPFSQERLFQAFERYSQKRAHSHDKTRSLAIKKMGVIELISIDEVDHIQADGHYSKIFTCNGTTHFHDKSIEKILNILPRNFMRVHRSYVVNMRYFVRLKIETGGKYWVDTKFSNEIPVSRAFYSAIKEYVGS